MYACEDCKDKVGANLKGRSPNRKTKCERCGETKWCFMVAIETEELEFLSACDHIKAVKKDLTVVEGWRDQATLLKYHDLTLGQSESWHKHRGSHCPTCGEIIDFRYKVIKDWDLK